MTWVRELVFRNTWMKALSLLLALVLWMVVFQGDALLDQTFKVPVRIVPGPSSVVMSQNVLMVEVGIKGTPILLRQLRLSDVVARVPLASEEAGKVKIELSAEHLGLPRELQEVSISPPTVIVTVEPKERKRVPVLDIIEGVPAAGYRVKSVRRQPSTVEVEGARSEVAALDGVPTTPIDISGRSESFQREVALAETGKRTVMVAEDIMVKVRVRIEVDPDYVAPETPPAGPAPPADTNAS